MVSIWFMVGRQVGELIYESSFKVETDFEKDLET